MDFKPVDADNHYYEPLDAFTRHLDKKYAWRGVHPVQDGKRVQVLINGKVNRFMVIPLCFGVQQRFFREEILDNFRPYASAGVGPTMLYVFPEKEEFINALGKGHPEYTVGGYIGLGAYFGSDVTNLIGLNMRYYFVPYPAGIEGLEGQPRTSFGGFFISVSVGNAW